MNFFNIYRFVCLCENILTSKAYTSIESYSKDFLAKLLSFRTDRVANIRVLLARVISAHILSLEYFLNGACPLANDLDMTIQYLSNDRDSDVKSYFSWSQNANEKTSLPPYDELFKNKLNDTTNSNSSNNNSTNEATNSTNSNTDESANNSTSGTTDLNLETKNSNFIYNCNELEKIDLINNNSSNTSNSASSIEAPSASVTSPSDVNVETNTTTSVKGVVYDDDDEEEHENMEEDEDDDDEDEIIDKTKINQLKIVNLEHDSDN